MQFFACLAFSCLLLVSPFAQGTRFEITLRTGSGWWTGTAANVHITFHGANGKSSPKIWLDNGDIDSGSTRIFHVEAAADLSPLSSVTIGHDNSGWYPGWYLTSVSVFSPDTGLKQYFPCSAWLDTDRSLTKTLHEDTSRRTAVHGKGSTSVSGTKMATAAGTPYQITLKTGSRSWAGTAAKVHIIFHGANGKSSPKIWLHNGDLDMGSTHTFHVKAAADLSPLSSITIGHDDSGWLPGWYLTSVSVFRADIGRTQHFPCNAWLDSDPGDSLTKTLYDSKTVQGKTKMNVGVIVAIVVGSVLVGVVLVALGVVYMNKRRSARAPAPYVQLENPAQVSVSTVQQTSSLQLPPLQGAMSAPPQAAQASPAGVAYLPGCKPQADAALAPGHGVVCPPPYSAQP